MQPVLEVLPSDDFALWPIAEAEKYGFMVLGGELTQAEVGTAVMRIARCNDWQPPHPVDPLGSFLHGLLTRDVLFAAGGLRVTDSVTGVVFMPGCCHGLEDWREWYGVLDGSGGPYFGHDPAPSAERHGDLVRLTVDVEQSDSPVIELPGTELQGLLVGAEGDLVDFHALAADWAARHVPDYASPVTAALLRVLRLGPPGESPPARADAL